MSFSQLDQIKLGKKGLLQRLSSLERASVSARIGPTGNGTTVVAGNGTVEVQAGGSIYLSQGGSLHVLDDGDISVLGGTIRAGTPGGSRTELVPEGLRGYDDSNQLQVQLASSTGKFNIYGPGSVVVSGGGSILAGQEDANRLELKATGIYAYNELGDETVSISTTDGKVRLDADAFIVAGTVNFDSLAVSGELIVNQDFRIGANILFVDQSQSNIGINRAPDPQFDLDVAGNFRAGGYIVGKHAIQLKDAVMICHYDSGANSTNGDTSGHKGQVATIGAGVPTFTEGKFDTGLNASAPLVLSYGSDALPTGSAGTIMVSAKITDPSFDPATYYNTVFYAEGSTSNIGIMVSGGVWSLYTGFTFYPLTTVPAINTWYDFVVDWDNTTKQARVWVNNTLERTVTYTTNITFGGASRLYVGSFGTDEQLQGTVDELVVVSRKLSDAERTAIYESNAPVFAETSTWGFRTANTLAWADSEGLWAIDASGNAAFGVSGVNGKSWGNLGATFLDKGDVLIGNSSNYVLWDASAGKLNLVGQMAIGSTNKLWLNDSNDGSLAIGGTNKATAPFRVSATGGLTATSANISGTVTTGATNKSVTLTGGTVVLTNTATSEHPLEFADSAGVYAFTYASGSSSLPILGTIVRRANQNAGWSVNAYGKGDLSFASILSQVTDALGYDNGNIRFVTERHIFSMNGNGVAIFPSDGATRTPVAITGTLGVGIGSDSTLGIVIRTPSTSGIGLRVVNSVNNAVNLDTYDNGNAFLRGTLTQGSDRSLKTQIQPLLIGLAEMRNYQARSYIRKASAEEDWGFVVDEVEQYVPTLVHYRDGVGALNYSGFIPVHHNAILELDSEITELKATIAALQEEVAVLRGTSA